MADRDGQPDAGRRKRRRRAEPRPGLLASLRIRKKLLLLHTVFSVLLAASLLLAIRPAMRNLVERTEEHECRVALDLFMSAGRGVGDALLAEGVSVRIGQAAALGVSPDEAVAARNAPGHEVMTATDLVGCRIVRWSPEIQAYYLATARSPEARAAVIRIYTLIAVSLLGAYALIALSLEVFVLPKQVYRPIRRLLAADEAVSRGDRALETIPEAQIPADELGLIMRSRNESIERLRAKENQLSAALERLEVAANDLKRKNHLLEAARQNLADQDKLVSLGMMSAGLAHELNTPLTVLKGSVERLAERPGDGVNPGEARLMLRVVNRLERLSESLLDFARVRPPRYEEASLREIVDDAWTLVRLDRDAIGVRLLNEIPADLRLVVDPDRIGQVFVNLLRNATDAMDGDGKIRAWAEVVERDGAEWVGAYCADSGPGIDPDVLPRLFEPFTSTRLDSKGTGLGLAVAEGIVREHGGMLLAQNARGAGAIFEVMLPRTPLASRAPVAHDASGDPARRGGRGGADSAPESPSRHG
ncbi:MAG: sensor histidine kinase [Phycisphaerales bacterium]